MRVGILASHPIQYHAPWFRELGKSCELQVFFAHAPSSVEQAVGFGGGFEWDVDLLSGYPHRFLRNVARTPGTQHFFGCDTPEIATIVSQGQYDAFIVSGWNLKSYWQAVHACHRAGVPVLVRGDSQLRSGQRLTAKFVKRCLYPQILRRFDAFLSVGKRNRQYLTYFGVPPEKIFFVPHFVDNQWFAERAIGEVRPRTRTALGVDDETMVILFVGKFVVKKRPLDLLAATEHLGGTIKKHVLLVGSGMLEAELQRFATERGLDVRFEGFRNQTELPQYYAAADVLILPSDDRETWGLVVNEMMACGHPAIVSDGVGCAPDLIEDGKTGFTYACGDIAALANSIRRFDALRQRRFDFQPHLDEKLKTYSLEFAVAETLRALYDVVRSRPSQLSGVMVN